MAEALISTCFKVISCMTFSSTLNAEATYSSEMLVDFQRATRHYIPEDGIFNEQMFWFKRYFISSDTHVSHLMPRNASRRPFFHILNVKSGYVPRRILLMINLMTEICFSHLNVKISDF
jgi:hypothetical protein